MLNITDPTNHPAPETGQHVTIIMAVYNPDLTLFHGQVRSILDQSYRNFRLLMVTDGPQQDMPAIASVAASDPRITLHKQSENRGPTATFLAGLALAVGDESNEYFLYSDQDDIWHANKIATLRRAIVQNACSAVHSDAEVIRADGTQIAPSLFASERRQRDVGLIDLFFCNNATGMTMLFDRAVAQHVAAFSERPLPKMLHDHLTAIFAAASKGLSFVDQPLVRYIQHGGNVVGHTASPPFSIGRFFGLSFLRSDSMTAKYINDFRKFFPALSAIGGPHERADMQELRDIVISNQRSSLFRLGRHFGFSPRRKPKILARLMLLKLLGR